MPDTTTARHLAKLMHELDSVLQEHGTTRAEVQRQLGWGNSRISDLKVNPSPLRISDLLQILSVVGVRAPDFLARVHGRPEPPAEIDEIREAIEHLIEKLEAVHEPARKSPLAARRIAQVTAMLVRPMAYALREGASATAVEEALVEILAVAYRVCSQNVDAAGW